MKLYSCFSPILIIMPLLLMAGDNGKTDIRRIDLLAMGKTDISAEGITVDGIGVGAPLLEVYTRFNKSDRDLREDADQLFQLEINRSLKFYSLDGKIVDGITISTGYPGLQGTTKEVLELTDQDSLEDLLKRRWGKNDGSQTNFRTHDGITTFDISHRYGNGIFFSFSRSEKKQTTSHTVSIDLVSPRHRMRISQKAIDGGFFRNSPRPKEKKVTQDKPFRDADWGMSQAGVLKTETGSGQPVARDEDGLVFVDHLAGFPVQVVYLFDTDALFCGKYIFKQPHSNLNHFINDYEKISNLLEQKYGKPQSNQSLWQNTLFKGDRQQWGTAIAMGHLVYQAQWVTPRVRITLLLSGENLDVSLVLQYMNPLYRKSDNRLRKELEKF